MVTTWDVLSLLMLLGITAALLIDIRRPPAGSAAPRIQANPEPPGWAKALAVALILAGCAWLCWYALQEPMKLHSTSRRGLQGARGPVFSVHGYIYGVLGSSVALWLLIAYVKSCRARSDRGP